MIRDIKVNTVIYTFFQSFTLLRILENTSSCVYRLFSSVAAWSASSKAVSTPSVSLEYASRLKTTMEPYPFLVSYTGSPSPTRFSISVNLFRKSEIGLICIIAISYHNFIAIIILLDILFIQSKLNL